MPIILLLIVLGLPALLLYLEPRTRLISWIGPVFWCYLLGILLGNIFPIFLSADNLSIVETVNNNIMDFAVVLALPLLLFQTDIKAWMRLSGKVMASFGLCILSVGIVSFTVVMLMKGELGEYWKLGGMSVGVYTGGTPNLAAIGKALGVDQEIFISMNIADLMICGIWFLLLISVAKPLLSLILPDYTKTKAHQDIQTTQTETQAVSEMSQSQQLRSIGLSLGLSILILALVAGLTFLIVGKLDDGVIIVGVTILGLLASLYKPIRKLAMAYDVGQYLLLIFCVAIGMSVSIDVLFNSPAVYFKFLGLIIGGTLTLHFIFAAIFRLDVDTILITSTAALFGPPFIGPIARVLGNREIIAAGLTVSVLGLALGTFAGLGFAWFLQLF